VHVDAANYGIVEDVHQSVMHVFAQYLRQSWMPPADIKKPVF
jgi:D-sedoheptulose 7-phosphate isomerase